MAVKEQDRGPQKEFNYPEVVGDFPPNIDIMPGSVAVDAIASPGGLEKAVDGKLSAQPHILSEAKKLGKDMIGVVSSHGKEILIGVGVASLAIGATTAGVVVIYRHRNRS